MAVSESLKSAALRITGSKGKQITLPATRREGPPFSYSAIVAKPAAGHYEVRLEHGTKAACVVIPVAGHRDTSGDQGKIGGAGTPVWASRLSWDGAAEGFYSAWIEQLFDAPVEVALGFRPLHQALRDPERNFLHNHLGLREDDPGNRRAIAAAPDCADLPYFLRAYFAWKIGLPFAFRDCDRGTDKRPPRCGAVATNEAPAQGKDTLAAAQNFFRQLGNKVQSGSARTALLDDETDYYPVALDRVALRPGVTYADPYGHVLMIVKWVPQDLAAGRGGLLLAVDGQPDTSIARKRFWEGTFLFDQTPGAGPGFKAFRPVVAGRELPNAGITAATRFAPFSAEQAGMTPESFYARMAKLINPAGLDPEQAYTEKLDALVEQLQTRVGSVDNGEGFMRGNNNPVIPMPEGAKIFETTGPWEDYATPSRDMRLLIAMKVVLGLPGQIFRHPDLFKIGKTDPGAAAERVRALHARLIAGRTIEYRRSNGVPVKLTVADLLGRRTQMEMAYNPNDCAEIRWGAAAGTSEYATCLRHAPAEQLARMEQMRPWFRDARRPAR